MTTRIMVPDASLRHLAVMVAITTQGHPHTVRSLARDLGMSKPATCRALDRLGHQGLLARQPDPTDRRSVLVVPTAEGRDWLHRAAQDVRALLADAVAEAA